MTGIPNAVELYKFISFHPYFYNTLERKELGFEKHYITRQEVKSRVIRLQVADLWDYGHAHERIPILMNPIMDSIMKGQIEKQEEV